MAWSDKVSDTGAQTTAAATVVSDLLISERVSITRATFSTFLDGTETIEECMDWLFEQLEGTDKGVHVERGNFDLSSSTSKLKGEQSE